MCPSYFTLHPLTWTGLLSSFQLELTIGNAGNALDGQILSTVGRPDADADSVSETTVLMNEELGELLGSIAYSLLNAFLYVKNKFCFLH